MGSDPQTINKPTLDNLGSESISYNLYKQNRGGRTDFKIKVRSITGDSNRFKVEDVSIEHSLTPEEMIKSLVEGSAQITTIVRGIKDFVATFKEIDGEEISMGDQS